MLASINFCRGFSVAVLLLTIADAQQCYYPDGTASSDIACNSTAAASACCGSSAFCMTNGLCFDGGVVSRGSCTDRDWTSGACAAYCKTDNPSTSVGITACGTDTFACGLNSTSCTTNTNTFNMQGGDSFVLRKSQLATFVASSATNMTARTYTVASIIAVACGVGVPLLIALIVAIILLQREKRKHRTPKLMYKLPDDHDEVALRLRTTAPPPQLRRAASAVSLVPPSTSHSMQASHRGSFSTMHSHSQLHPMQDFMKRYESMKKSKVLLEDLASERHELDGAPPYREVERHELSNKRMSKT